MMARSTSALNPVAAGVPAPASVRGVKDSSPKKLTRGDNADARCSTNCPSLNPRGPSDLFCAAKSILPNPVRRNEGYSDAGGAAWSGCVCAAPEMGAPRQTVETSATRMARRWREDNIIEPRILSQSDDAVQMTIAADEDRSSRRGHRRERVALERVRREAPEFLAWRDDRRHTAFAQEVNPAVGEQRRRRI